MTSTSGGHPAAHPKRTREYQKHGIYGLSRSIKRRGLRAVDGRSALARGVAVMRAEVESDLGGVENLSRAERILLDSAMAQALLLGVIDGWLAAHPGSVVSTRRRAVAPVVRERVTVSKHLAELLRELGLKRRQREVLSLGAYLSSKATPQPTMPQDETTGAAEAEDPHAPAPAQPGEGGING